MERYTIAEARAALGGIDAKTILDWCEKAEITPAIDKRDQRRKIISATDLARLAADHEREILTLDDAPRTLPAALAIIARQADEIRRLKERLAGLDTLATMRNSPVTRYEQNLTVREHEQYDSSSEIRHRTRIAPERGASSVDTIPIGCEIVIHFCDRHRIARTTAQTAFERGELNATHGVWKRSNHTISHILDPEQQRAFIAWASQRPTYQRCQTEECPCHDEAPIG